METISRGKASSRTGDCGCGGGSRSGSAVGYVAGTRSATGGFAFGTLERPRYYPRQLMTPDDLNLEADYFRDKLRRHNMFLHGWGVVCGALVCTVPARKRGTARDEYLRQRSELKREAENYVNSGATEPWLVRIEPGYILGPFGDEIVIDQPVEVSLQGNGTSVCGSDSSDDDMDPWCAEVYEARRSGPLYIAVKYRECLVRPVASAPGGCDCAEEPCEYSRFRDGYEIGFLDCCPDSHVRPAVEGDRLEREKNGNPSCAACPDDPWVVLAKVEVDAKGIVQIIDNCSCRRVMLTTRDRWMVCTGSDCDRSVDTVYEDAKDDVAAEVEPSKPVTAKAASTAAARKARG